MSSQHGGHNNTWVRGLIMTYIKYSYTWLFIEVLKWTRFAMAIKIAEKTIKTLSGNYNAVLPLFIFF